MKLRELGIGVITCVLVATLAVVWSSDTGASRAPSVELTLLDGQKLQLDDLRGQPVMVTFWATTCVGCQSEVPHLVELYEEFQPRGFEIIAVAMAYDPPAQVYEFSKHREVPYRIALDLDNQVASAFGEVRLTPATFLVDGDGRIVYQVLGEFNTPQVHKLIE
ncbi:MAG: TlpA family protein disulfide reductase, partial [Gammaproteobacteria bacterium]|nr:TlpA family protein disulfide reductase [Gammaproteobacteria bacterium]